MRLLVVWADGWWLLLTLLFFTFVILGFHQIWEERTPLNDTSTIQRMFCKYYLAWRGHVWFQEREGNGGGGGFPYRYFPATLWPSLSLLQKNSSIQQGKKTFWILQDPPSTKLFIKVDQFFCWLVLEWQFFWRHQTTTNPLPKLLPPFRWGTHAIPFRVWTLPHWVPCIVDGALIEASEKEEDYRRSLMFPGSKCHWWFLWIFIFTFKKPNYFPLYIGRLRYAILQMQFATDHPTQPTMQHSPRDGCQSLPPSSPTPARLDTNSESFCSYI